MASPIAPGKPRDAKTSLRRLILCLVISLVALVWLGAGRDMLRALGGYIEAKAMIAANRRVDALLQAAQNIAFERGRANVLLKAPGPASSPDLDFLASKRAESASRLEPLLGPGGLEPSLQNDRLRTAYSAMLALRPRVDRDIALSAREREPGLPAAWVKAASAVVEDCGIATALLVLEKDRFTLSFRSYSRLKLAALDMRDALGQEASRIASGLGSGALSAVELEASMTLRGRGEHAWKDISREAAVAANPAIDQALARVDEDFFVKFRPLQDAAIASLRDKLIAPFGVSLLTAASQPALDSIASLMEKLTAETDSDCRAYLAEAARSMVIAVLEALTALALGAWAILTVARRLILPLRVIAERLKDLSEGRLDFPVEKPGRRDEMGLGYLAVIELRDSIQARQRLEEKLTLLSQEDVLTGLANRRRLDQALAAEWQRAVRQGQSLALAMFDIDFFKEYNDQHGHQAGDECLKAVAMALLACARRSSDLVARYGGEEFLVILPGLDGPGARRWAEEARLAVRKLSLPHQAGITGIVTISCGVAAACPLRGTDASGLLKEADDALYRAKEEGRDRVAG